MVAVAACAVPPSVAAAAPPSTPSTPSSPSSPSSQSTLEAAQARRDAATAAVLDLTAQVSAADAAIAADQARAQVAEQQYAYQVQNRDAAQRAEDRARIEQATARRSVAIARAELSTLVRDQYENGQSVAIGTLVAAPDAGAVLDGLALGQQVSVHQAQVTEELKAAVAQLTAAERSTRAALAAQTAATTASRRALEAARDADDRAQNAAAALVRRLDAARHDQSTAIAAAQLAGAHAKAAAGRDALLTRYRSRVQGSPDDRMPPSAGHWTPAIADAVVNRALRMLGTPYSFAAGNALGPTYGIAADDASRNDAHVFGLDCSGLTLYAWAPYLVMDHFAATQYSQAGRLHPAIESLEPGDLIFWSATGRQSGVGHVAMYVGDGNVIQAPQSGDIVRITPLLDVEPGYFGATRPLT